MAAPQQPSGGALESAGEKERDEEPDRGVEVHEGRVRNLIEARFDIGLKHPLVAAGGELMHLGDGVMGSAFRADPWEHGRKSAAKIGSNTSLRAACTVRSARGGDTESATFRRPRLRDRPFPHGYRGEPPGLEIFS
jgi:hypothetical protein